jgi:hypothetical protein
MTNGDDVQRELQALLTAVDPSPAFAAGVRARVAEEGAQRSRGAAWAWALGGAVCLASFAWPLLPRGPSVVSDPTAPAKGSVALAQPHVPPTSSQPRPPERAGLAQISRRARSGVPPLAPAPAAVVNAEAGDTYVLVPDDQRIALVNLLQRLHQGRATVPASIVPAYDKDGLLVPPPLIVIAPLPGPALLDLDDKSAAGDAKGSAKDKQ